MKQIQWFPGHMQKARKAIEAKLPMIDIVYELVDARIPQSSRNPLLGDIIGKKPRLLVLNKADLADEQATQVWIEHFRTAGIEAIAVNALTDSIQQPITQITKTILKEMIAKEATKGMKQRAFRAMVIGIPNVGKSQFINALAGKQKVKTGNVPGITKMQSYINANKDLLLLDNPGVLWPKFDDQHIGFRLALLGSIKDDILPLDDVAIYGIEFMKEHYPRQLELRYDLKAAKEMTAMEIMDAIGHRRGCLMGGGDIDYERVINLFLYEIRNKKMGRITLEMPSDV